MGTFKEDMVLYKSTDKPMFTKSFTTTNESFQMRYCVMLDASNYQNLKIFPNSLDKKDFFGILTTLVILIQVEEEAYLLLHFKDLIIN